MAPNTDETPTVHTATDAQVAELRAALDDQLERVRSLSVQEGWQLSVDEQLTQLLILSSQYPEDAMSKAVLRPLVDDESSEDYTGRLPIHLACDTNAPVEIIQWLLSHDPSGASILQKDKWGDLPIHTACSRRDYVEVVRLLLGMDPQNVTVFTEDNYGALPLHMACRYGAPPAVIQMLLESDPEKRSLKVAGMYGQLPIHVACRCNLAPESVELLLLHDAHKDTVLIEDSAGRLALHVAYLRHPNHTVLRLLLEAMICHRIERIGFDLWKKDMRQLLRSLSTHERDFNASDKLEMTREALKGLMERTFVLELAIWKCHFVHGVCPSLTDADRATYKQECRIKSGAGIIIPGVLAFVENESIVQLLSQF